MGRNKKHKNSIFDNYSGTLENLQSLSRWVHYMLSAKICRVSIMPLENQTKRDWLVRCKMEHAEKETEAVYSRL